MFTHRRLNLPIQRGSLPQFQITGKLTYKKDFILLMPTILL